MTLCSICRRNLRCEIKDQCRKNPKLNIGSGHLPFKDHINLDGTYFENKTDIVCSISDMLGMLPTGYFKQIQSIHVIEHLYKVEARTMMQDVYHMLQKGGVAVVEAPCVLGSYEVYVNRKNNVEKYIDMLFADTGVDRNGEAWRHKSGWTGPIVAEMMKSIGFKIRHVGKGLRHGMGIRDFRVEGVK